MSQTIRSTDHLILDAGGDIILKTSSTERARISTTGVMTGLSATPAGSAGGDLTGTYPNPTVAAGKIGATQLADPGTGKVWGSNGAGGAAAVNGTADPLAVALGYVNWPCSPEAVTGGVAALGSQILIAHAIWLPAGVTVTGAVPYVVTAAAGTKPTGAFFGLADNTKKMLAQTGDVSGNLGVPFAAVGPAACAFTATFATTYAGLHYMVGLINGTYGTTQPQFLRTGSATGDALGAGAIFMGAVAAQTALPANGATLPALTSAGQTVLWIAAY